jgi:hypothetical protein
MGRVLAEERDTSRPRRYQLPLTPAYTLTEGGLRMGVCTHRMVPDEMVARPVCVNLGQESTTPNGGETKTGARKGQARGADWFPVAG